MDPSLHGDQRRVECDLLVRLPQRRTRRVLTAVEAPAREADLAPVGAQRRGAPGEDQPGLTRFLEEQGEHRRIDRVRPGRVGLVDQHGRPDDPLRADALRRRSTLSAGLERTEHAVHGDPAQRHRRKVRPGGRRA